MRRLRSFGPAWLVLTVCAAPAFAVTGAFEAEPPREAPARAEPSSIPANLAGEVGVEAAAAAEAQSAPVEASAGEVVSPELVGREIDYLDPRNRMDAGGRSDVLEPERLFDGARPADAPAEPAPLEPSAPAPSRARLQELLARAKRERARLSAFWSRAAPARVRIGPKSFPLTHSLDTELEPGDAFRIIERDPGSLAELDDELGPPVPASRLAALAGLTNKDLERFALRPGVARGAQAYRYSDLRPSYFGRVMDEHHSDLFGGLHLAVLVFRRLAGQAISHAGLPRKSGDDGVDEGPVPLVSNPASSDLELAHESWEESPLAFGTLIRRLHRGLFRPHTHLHVGLPSAIGKDAAVARAVETLMILELASAPPSQLDGRLFRHSTLSPSVYGRIDDARGLINFRFGEWLSPHPSDNLELRFYPDVETGLRWQALAATLAQRHKRLKVYRDFEPRWPATSWGDHDDPPTVNLSAALEYASLILGGSPEADTRQIADDLRLLSDAAGRQLHGPENRISLKLREKIARYLRSRRVRERLTTDTFLKPVSRPSSATTPAGGGSYP